MVNERHRDTNRLHYCTNHPHDWSYAAPHPIPPHRIESHLHEQHASGLRPNQLRGCPARAKTHDTVAINERKSRIKRQPPRWAKSMLVNLAPTPDNRLVGALKMPQQGYH